MRMRIEVMYLLVSLFSVFNVCTVSGPVKDEQLSLSDLLEQVDKLPKDLVRLLDAVMGEALFPSSLYGGRRRKTQSPRSQWGYSTLGVWGRVSTLRLCTDMQERHWRVDSEDIPLNICLQPVKVVDKLPKLKIFYEGNPGIFIGKDNVMYSLSLQGTDTLGPVAPPWYGLKDGTIIRRFDIRSTPIQYRLHDLLTAYRKYQQLQLDDGRSVKRCRLN